MRPKNLKICAVFTAMLLIPLLVSPAQAGIRDSAVVFYAMDDAAGSLSAADSGTLGNAAVLNLTAAFDGTAGKFGGGINLGTSYLKNTMDFATATGDFTLAMWVNTAADQNGASGEAAFSFADTGGTNMPKYGPFMYWAPAAGEGLAAQAQWASGAWTNNHDPDGNTNSLTAGEWNHIATTYEFSTASWKLWLNGVTIVDKGYGGQNQGLHNMIIGSFGGTDGVVGTYDEVGYWDYALNSGEMAELQVNDAVIPEPTSIFLLASGLIAVGLRRRSRA